MRTVKEPLPSTAILVRSHLYLFPLSHPDVALPKTSASEVKREPQCQGIERLPPSIDSGPPFQII